jgi:hypothetical protein
MRSAFVVLIPVALGGILAWNAVADHATRHGVPAPATLSAPRAQHVTGGGSRLLYERCHMSELARRGGRRANPRDTLGQALLRRVCAVSMSLAHAAPSYTGRPVSHRRHVK